MLLKIFKILYPTIFKYEVWFYEQRSKRIETEAENKGLKEKISQINESLSLMKELSQSNNLISLKSFTDNTGKTMFLRITEDLEGVYQFIDIETYDPLKEGLRRNGCLFVQKHRGYVKITDFRVLDENKGIGSIMLTELFRILNNRNIVAHLSQSAIRFDNSPFLDEIHGELAYTDWDHIDKLEYFYSKFGFKVSTDHSKKRGSIEKKMIVPK